MPDRPLRLVNPRPDAAVARSAGPASLSDDHSFLKSRVLKRSIVVGRHKTSVSLEDVFWNGLRSIATEQGVPLSQLVASIDAERQHCNLSSALRVFVFEQSCQRGKRDGSQT